MTPDIAAAIQEARLKVLRGEYALEDIAKAVALYRDARGVVAKRVEEKAAKPKAAKKAKVTGDDLLNGIIGEQS